MSAIPGYYTVQEAADVIGVSHVQVTRYIADKRLPCVKIGRNMLIEQKSVHDFERPLRGNPDFRKQASKSA